VKTVPLTKGKVALVDDCDFESISKYKWHLVKGKYAARGIREGKATKAVYMHRLILNAPKEMLVDHRDGDGLNNQRANLRLASRRENARNRPEQKNNKAGLKGVSQVPSGRWRASIRANRRLIYLGIFETANLAADAYQQAAKAYHGQFAYYCPMVDKSI